VTAASIISAAEKLDLDASRLAELGMRSVGGVVRLMRVAMITRMRAGGSPVEVVRPYVTMVADRLARSMAVSHAMGLVRSEMLAARQKGEEVEFADPYEATIRFIDRRNTVSRSKLRLLEQQYRRYAVSATGKLASKAETAVQEAVRQNFTLGRGEKDGIAAVRKALDRTGFEISKPHSVQTMYRTQTNVAFNAGRWEANQDPAIQDILWGYEYTTMGDDLVRPNHAAMDGARYQKDDPIWRRIWPPNGHNCRCQTVEIFKGDRLARRKTLPESKKINGITVVPGPDDGWAVNFAEVFKS